MRLCRAFSRLLEWQECHGLSATGCHDDLELILCCHLTLFDAIGSRVGREVCLGCVGIDDGTVFLPCLEEVEGYGDRAGIVARSGSQEVLLSGTTGGDDKLSGFSTKGLAPDVPLHAAGSLTGHHIGIGTADAGVFDGLVGVDGGVVAGGGLYDTAVVTHVELAMMVMTVGQTAGIACLDT